MMEHKQHGLEPLVIEEDKQEPIKCYGFCRSTPRVFIAYLLCVLTLGALLLVFYWKPNWRLRMMHARCSLPEADAVLIRDVYQREHVKYIDTLEVNDASVVTSPNLCSILKKDVTTNGYLKYFCYQRMKYIWDPENCTFFLLRAPELGLQCHEFTDGLHHGLSKKDVEIRQHIFGPNAITIHVKPILVLLVQEVLNPFYVFQIYSCMVWLAFAYWTFTLVIIFMTAISIGVSLYLTRKHSITLRKMAESFLKVKVLRPDGSSVEEMETELVPGDVILIPPQGCTMTCDAVLINGTCIVNEGMLTGESIPVTKVPLASQKTDDDDDIYSPDLHKRHTLFCGTKVIQTRQAGKDKVKAVVVQTGFSTFKGSLVRTILYPRPMEFKLYRDAMMFVGFYVALAAVGIIYSAVVLSALGQKPLIVLIFTLDTTTIAIQPLLPVALTVGMLYAQVRLKKRGIFCISPQRINLAGILDVVCFDKTGTLTEDGLDLLGVRRKEDETFLSMEADAASLPECPFLHTMVTCHSLAIIEGQLQGDPMDMKMFEATKWTFEEKEEVVSDTEGEKRHITVVKSPADSQQSATQFTILKQFTFSSALQRMSVIAEQHTSGEIAGFVKGSPEMILKLCNPSTVPSDFSEVLESYTKNGFRVIALAWKPLERFDDVDGDGLSFKRDDVESDLTFLGFLVWQNPLKPESLPAIAELQKANIRTIMVTGDNIQTAINVAGKCGMVSNGDSVVHVSALVGEKTQEEALELEYKRVSRNLGKETEESILEKDNCQTVLMMSGKEHYAIDGKTFALIQEKFPLKLQEIVLHGTVFARMAPSQKQELVEALQCLEYTVGMCGDGANDCGALKTAHAGISLSDAEASVASPFTSKIENISCVPILIKEGRSALVTSFGLFKYIAMYTFIMFVTTCITKKLGAYPGNNMFTFWEIAIVTPIVLLMGRSGPFDTISEKKPPTRLVTVPSLCSVMYHVLILLLSQAVATLLVENQTWYTVFVPDPDLEKFDAPSWEATVTFIVANFQYVMYGLVFTPRPPYQASIKKNPLFLVYTAVATIVCSLLILVPAEKLESKVFGMHHIPDYKFRVILFFLCVVNFLLSFVVEYFIFPRETVQKMLRCWRNESTPKYSEIIADTQADDKLKDTMLDEPV